MKDLAATALCNRGGEHCLLCYDPALCSGSLRQFGAVNCQSLDIVAATHTRLRIAAAHRTASMRLKLKILGVVVLVHEYN